MPKKMNALFREVTVHLFVVVIAFCSLTPIASSETVYEALGRDSNLSEFYAMVNKDEVLQVLLDRRSVTVFAPNNEAIRQYRTSKPKDIQLESFLPSYHVLNLVAKTKNFPTSIPPYLAGVAPLYMTAKEFDGSDEKEYYVNNAKIIKSAEYQGTEHVEQLLYVVDELLLPYRPIITVPPNALDFLNQPGIYESKHSFGAFSSRVISDHEKDLFRRVGNHTFFLPVGAVDSHNYNRLQNMDMWVVRGHVIPNHVLFTRTMSDAPYRSEAYTDTLKVVLSLVNETHPDSLGYTLYAQSNTILSDKPHRKGVVRTKIIEPNIPVSNGVVHLIQSPLMIIDKTIWDFIEQEKGGRLSEFASLVSYENDFVAHLSSTQEKTVFAPTNEALRELPVETRNMLKRNITALKNLLDLHMVMKSISTEDVWNGGESEILASDNRRSLYFRAIGDERNKTLTVEGGGVNATAVQADMGTTNGIVHIIDRVLGLPYLTVFRKLKSDPDLKPTFKLGEQDEWVRMLDDSKKNYTFFVPSRKAWEHLRENMPTEHKQMNLGIYSYHVKKILDRHLVVGQVLTSQDLEKVDEVQMVHGVFKIRRGFSSSGLDVEWEGITAKIVRADVQATNGIIHVIDRVMMKRRDMTKGSAATFGFVPGLVSLLLAVTIMSIL